MYLIFTFDLCVGMIYYGVISHFINLAYFINLQVKSAWTSAIWMKMIKHSLMVNRISIRIQLTHVWLSECGEVLLSYCLQIFHLLHLLRHLLYNNLPRS